MMGRRRYRRGWLRPHRSAWTLIELVTVLTLTSMLMGVVIATFYVLLRADRSWRDETAGQKEIALLAEAFRRDVHRAETMVVGDAGDSVELGLSDARTIVYRRDGERLLRSERREDTALQPLSVFRLGSWNELRFSEDETADLHVASMVITFHRAATATSPTTAARLPHRFDAVVGRDRKWTLP